MLTGTARIADDGLTYVALDGGGTVLSTEPGEGPVAVSIYPWEIALSPPARAHRLRPEPSPRPRRVGHGRRQPHPRRAAAPQPLTAELSDASAHELDLTQGADIIATWKASATRLLRL